MTTLLPAHVVYASDENLSEPADVLLEHAVVALGIEERFVIAQRLAQNLGYEVRPRARSTKESHDY